MISITLQCSKFVRTWFMIIYEQLSGPRTRRNYIYDLQLKMGIPWTKARTLLMYKIIHNLVEICAEHLLIPSDCRTRGVAAFRTIHSFMYRFSFFPRAPSSSGTAYKQQYVRPVPSASSRQGEGLLPFPCSRRCK